MAAGGNQVDEKKALEMVRLKYNLSAVGIEAGSWQEDLLAACKSKFAIKPQRLKTALFYTQVSKRERLITAIIHDMRIAR